MERREEERRMKRRRGGDWRGGAYVERKEQGGDTWKSRKSWRARGLR